MTRIRIVVADDHPLYRASVVMACREDSLLEVVGEAPNGDLAVEVCTELDPDVLVLDLNMPGKNGFEVVQALKEKGSKSRILVLTVREDSRAVFEAVRADVDGFVDKASIEDVAEAIKVVAAGERFFDAARDRQAVTGLKEFVRHSREGSRLDHLLTEREVQVLGLIREGMITRQIASRLGMSERTVESHIKKLYRKMGVHNRVEAVAKGEEFDLFP